MQKEPQYYTSGEFAKKARVTLRTIRYYDQKNILNPSLRKESGARLYTDEDLARLQQILLLKYLGFSLEEIREMTIASGDPHFLLSSLTVQRKLLGERIEQMKAMVDTIDHAAKSIQEEQSVDWQSLLELIHMTSMEDSLRDQYVDATNISARISLHRDYSTNPEGWFPWIYRHLPMQEGMKILEVGSGSGELWLENRERLPEHVTILLTDTSEGMLRDAREKLEGDPRFSYECCSLEHLPYEAGSFDLVIANHVLFYSEDVGRGLKELHRMLKTGGVLAASTYGPRHMVEITRLVRQFHPDIVLAAENLYDRFGLENGRELILDQFQSCELMTYPDSIYLTEAEPLIAYILSCHGNQNRILIDQYREFREYVVKHVRDGYRITKEAGLFLARRL